MSLTSTIYIALELNPCKRIKITNIGRDKSFVDDLACGRGIVSMRVGFALRSAEIKPLSKDLCYHTT